MIEMQKEMREESPNSETMTAKQKNQKINNVLEDMCAYGAITKKEIKEEKAKHPEKFIETSQALKMEKNDEGLFALGLISQGLENLGIETAIEKDENPNEQEADSVGLQFIMNGMINKKKYDLHFELEKKEMKNYWITKKNMKNLKKI